MVVILKDIDVRTFTQPLPEYWLKIDPGAKYDGFAIIDPVKDTVVFTLQVEHRAEQVKQNLDTRRQARRNRRSRETVYRRNKFAQGGTFTQTGNEGKLPPSIQSILANTETWVNRLSRWVNLTSVSLEAVRFDPQLLDDPEIEGKEYQQGTLQGTEIREYLLDRYQHTCQYCGGVSGDPVLEWEHIRPRSRGGSDSIKNATLACHRCNQDKGPMTLEEWAGQLKTQGTKLSRARLQGIEKVLAGKRNGGSNRYFAMDTWFGLETLAKVILVLTCIWTFGYFGVVTFLVPQILSCIDRKREGRSSCPDHSIFIFFWILGFIILVPTFIFFHCRLTRNLLILWGVLYWIVVEIFWAIFGKEEKIDWDEEDEDKKPAEFHASETCTMGYPNIQKTSDPIRSLLERCDDIAGIRQLMKILDLIDQYEIKTPSSWKTQYLSLLKESLETYLGTSWRELPEDEYRKIQEDMRGIVSATLKQGQDIIHTYYQEKGTNLAVNRDVLEALVAPDAFTDKHIDNKN